MCEECDVGLTESLNLDNDLIIDFLVEHRVFKPEINCPECTSLIKLNRESLNYYCFKLENTGDEKRNCSKEISARVNTIFESCNVDINVYWQFITLLLHLRPPRYELFREELGLSNRLINDLCLYSRDVLIRDCLEKSEKLGGNSKCVEVESSLDKSKSKHSNTHNLALSGMEIESKKSFFVVIINPEPANILAVLKKWILPNTTVVTDCSKICICLDDEQFREYTIESSVNFVKPEMFNQFNKSMARTWREVSLSSTPSCKSNFSGLLGEYQFKRKYTRLQRLHHFFKAAGHLNQHSTEQESGSMES